MGRKVFLQNSFCTVEGFEEKYLELIQALLTYQNDIEADRARLLYQMKVKKQFIELAEEKGSKKEFSKLRREMGFLKKQLKDLEATEWVCWFKEGSFPTGHYRLVKELFEELGVEFEEIDQRELPDNKAYNLDLVEADHEGRYYQNKMVEIGVKEGRGVFESAVGTGKSWIMRTLIRTFNVPTIVIVPSRPLKKQHSEEMARLFGKYKFQVYSAEEIRKTKRFKPIRLVTIQTLASLYKSGDLDKFLEGVGHIQFDEFHHAGSKSYTDLLPALEKIYYRFGFTGTFLRNDSKTLDMWGILSNRLYSYSAEQAIKDGFLTPLVCHVHNIPGEYRKNYQKEYNENYCKNKARRRFKKTLASKTKPLFAKIEEIIKSAGEDAQVLILVSRKDKAGAAIHEYLKSQGIRNTYISGDDDSDHIEDSIKNFNEKKIKVLIGSQVIGEGVDIRSTDHIIMAQGGKSEIAVVQATGRVIRLFEGKDTAHLHDFRFKDTKYLEEHLNTRLEIYERNFGAKIQEESL